MKRNKAKEKKIVRERIEILFSEAAKIFSKNKKRSNRYVEIARKLAMKVNLSMPNIFRRQYCKYCYSYLRPGVNSTVRIRDSKIIIYCKECKKYNRMPLSKKSGKK
ncbi:MAG: ribonuclease P [Nanoarchaeota archaeon]|nr:ribonuclease P [Nanoarchaeota archaeon]